MKRSIGTEPPSNQTTTTQTKQGPTQGQNIFDLPADAINHILHLLPPKGQLSWLRTSKIAASSWENYLTSVHLNTIPSLENEPLNEKLNRLLAKQQEEIEYLTNTDNKKKILDEIPFELKIVLRPVLINNFLKLRNLNDKTAAAFYARENCLDNINQTIIDNRTKNQVRSELHLSNACLTRIPQSNNGRKSYSVWSDFSSVEISGNFLTFFPEDMPPNICLCHKFSQKNAIVQSISKYQSLALQQPFVKLTGPEALHNNNRLSILAAALLGTTAEKAPPLQEENVCLVFPAAGNKDLAIEMLKLNKMEEGLDKDYRETQTNAIEIYGDLRRRVFEIWRAREMENKSGHKLK